MKMRRISDSGISAVLVSIVLCVGCAAETRGIQDRPAQAARINQPELQRPDIVVSRLEKKIHDLINEERKKKGLSSLGWHDSLHRIARRYSQDMSGRHFFSHNDPEGKSFMDRYRDEGFA